MDNTSGTFKLTQHLHIYMTLSRISPFVKIFYKLLDKFMEIFLNGVIKINYFSKRHYQLNPNNYN